MKPHEKEVNIINIRLSNVFGKSLDGKAKFRIVFSDLETERRMGEFDEFYGKIFLRTVRGVKEVPKYSYVKSKWVLERYMRLPCPEVMNYNGYEPIYVFQDKSNNYLTPLWRICEIAIHSLFNPLDNNELKDYQERQEEKRIEQDIEKIENHCTDFSMLSRLGELVTVPSKEFINIEKIENREKESGNSDTGS